MANSVRRNAANSCTPSGKELQVAAFGYDVQIWQLGATATYVADLFTGTTSVTIPTNLPTSGQTYAFLIEAFADSRGNMASSPWHQGYPQAFVWSISAPVAIP